MSAPPTNSSPQSTESSSATATGNDDEPDGQSIQKRVATIEARLDALSGRVEAVDSADEAIEQRADAALAAVDRLESRLDEIDAQLARFQRAPDTAAPHSGDRQHDSQDGAATEQSDHQRHGSHESDSCGGANRDTAFEWAAPDEPDVAVETPQNDSQHPIDRREQHGQSQQTQHVRDASQSQSASGIDHVQPADSMADEQGMSDGAAPTATSGPDAVPDERGLIDRLRDRL